MFFASLPIGPWCPIDRLQHRHELSLKNSRLRHQRLQAARILGRHTREEWQALKVHYRNCCSVCGQWPKYGLTKDHIVPISKGGSDSISNIRPACDLCNSTRRNRDDGYIPPYIGGVRVLSRIGTD